jgi:hypothetical protein
MRMAEGHQNTKQTKNCVSCNNIYLHFTRNCHAARLIHESLIFQEYLLGYEKMCLYFLEEGGGGDMTACKMAYKETTKITFHKLNLVP